jgi:hypothetical protein
LVLATELAVAMFHVREPPGLTMPAQVPAGIGSRQRPARAPFLHSRKPKHSRARDSHPLPGASQAEVELLPTLAKLLRGSSS